MKTKWKKIGPAGVDSESQLLSHYGYGMYAALVLRGSAKTVKDSDVATCIRKKFSGNSAEFERCAIGYITGGCSIVG